MLLLLCVNSLNVLRASVCLHVIHKGGLDHKNKMWEREEKDKGKEDHKPVKFSFLGKFLLDDLV